MREIYVVIFSLVSLSLQAKQLFTVKAEEGFPVSCHEIYTSPSYTNLKTVIEEDIELTLDAAMIKCERVTGSTCVDVTTYTESLEDEGFCFATATVREK